MADWSVLGYWSDPIPGDPVSVRSGGTRYKNVASAISRAVTTLRALDDAESDAKSVDVILEKKDEVADSIQKAHDRYQTTGQALQDYAYALDRAQDQARAALSAAQTAESNADYYDSLATKYNSWASWADDDDDAKYYRRKRDAAREDASDYRNQVSSYRQQVVAAQSDRDTAAQTAINQIEDITSADGLNDSWWDNFANVLEAIAKIAEIVSTIAGILALCVSWIPVIGQALGAVLTAISAVAAVVAAVANIALAVGGKQSWGEALASVVGAVFACIGLGGLTKFLGKKVLGLMTKIKIKPSGQAGKFWSANSRAVGKAGEATVGIGSKTRIPSLSGLKKFRVPDILVKGERIGDVKNVLKLDATSGIAGQFDDYMQYGLQNGIRVFELHVASYTSMTRGLKALLKGFSAQGMTVNIRQISNIGIIRNGYQNAWNLTKSLFGGGIQKVL
jgi:hypothetical protein